MGQIPKCKCNLGTVSINFMSHNASQICYLRTEIVWLSSYKSCKCFLQTSQWKVESTCLCLMETSQYVFFVLRQWQCQRNTVYDCTKYGAKYVNVSHQGRQVKQSSLVSLQDLFKNVTAKTLMWPGMLYIMKTSPIFYGTLFKYETSRDQKFIIETVITDPLHSQIFDAFEPQPKVNSQVLK